MLWKVCANGCKKENAATNPRQLGTIFLQNIILLLCPRFYNLQFLRQAFNNLQHHASLGFPAQRCISVRLASGLFGTCRPMAAVSVYKEYQLVNLSI
jgi:hypothetical protein